MAMVSEERFSWPPLWRSKAQTVRMNVLILETYADSYADRLRQAFPDLTVYPVKGIADLALDLASIDVLIAFGMGINDDLIHQTTRLKWIQSLATGVDHFIRCPSLRPDVLLTSGRGIHGPAMSNGNDLRIRISCLPLVANCHYRFRRYLGANSRRARLTSQIPGRQDALF